VKNMSRLLERDNRTKNMTTMRGSAKLRCVTGGEARTTTMLDSRM
jgi:hypothetical protein